MLDVGRFILALNLTCALALAAGPVRRSGPGVAAVVLNQGGGGRVGPALSISNDALGNAVTGAMSSASGRFRLEPYASGYRPVGPPGEVRALRLDGPPGDTVVAWNPEPEADAYHLFRAESPTPEDPPPPIFDAYVCDIADPQTEEWQWPAPGAYYAYLVTAVNSYYESGLGSASGGIPRVMGTPCP